MSRRQATPETRETSARPEPLPTCEDSCLVVIEGPRLGHFVHLGEVPTVIGRAPAADFHLDHPSVSRRHCTVWEDALGAGVRDLDSKNGTRVNGTEVRRAPLANGDHLRVGDVVLKFVAGGSPESRYHQALYQLANLDYLTQLQNRRAFRELLDQEVERVGEEPGALSVAILDVDRFKEINDRHGHDAGDEALRSLAATVLGLLGPRASAGRLGGDEFCVFLPGMDLDAATSWCEGLQAALAVRRVGSEDGVAVSVSVGVATWTPDAGDAHELMRRADMALLRAKAAGRNRVCPAIMGE
jgi:two-component system cell cycle response regulator